MRIVRQLADDMRNNIDQAQHKIDQAYSLRDCSRAAADWYRSMAAQHLDFNGIGHAVAKKLIDDYKHSGQHSDLDAGMLMVYDSVHSDMIRREAELRYLIEQYSK